jgi:hypothetical protein
MAIETTAPGTADDPVQAAERFDTAKVVALSGWALTLFVCVVLIGAAAWRLAAGMPLDDTLKQWAGMALGFLFGNGVLGLVKDFVASR